MTLLIDFLCRFGWGLSLAMVLTPSAIVPAGFFRVNLLVVLGLATLAGLLEKTAFAQSLMVGAAIAAWLGSVAWLAERHRVGVALTVACTVLMGTATVATVSVQPGASVPAAWFLAACMKLLSGMVVGLTVHAMLLGHWYLNAPGMRVDALRRMIDLAIVAWGLQLAVSLSVAVVRWMEASGGVADSATVALGSLRWLAGLIGLPILLWLSRKTLDIPNTQSATGILYVACVAAIVGELTAQLLYAAVPPAR